VQDDRLVPADPLAAVRDGGAAATPFIIGANRSEWRWFSRVEPELPSDAEVIDRLATMVPDPEGTVARWRDHLDGKESLWNAWETERIFRAPAARMAAALARHRPADTYLYEFHWAPATSPMGACHGLELPFVFDRVRPRLLYGSNPPQALGDAMHRAWTAFVRTGDPNHADLPAWSPCDDRRQPMVFDDPPRMEERPFTEVMDIVGTPGEGPTPSGAGAAADSSQAP
jgi:para-nitrobenzyl esterase